MISRKPALGFIFVTLVLDILGIGLIVPILPKLVEVFEHGDLANASGTYGNLAALGAVMQFLCAPLLGSLSDRFGRRRVILVSLLGSGLDYFLLAFAPNLAWFYVGRVIAGITSANFAAATAYIADISPPEKRAANFGLIGAAFGLGFILGPALGGTLGKISLRLPFFIAGGLTLLNWLYGMFVLPESLAPENRRPFSWARSNPVGVLGALRQHPVVLGLAATWFLVSLAHQVYPGTWVLYTENRFGWDTAQAGRSLAVVGLCAALVQGGLTRVLIPRLGERASVVLGLSISALAFVAYGLAWESWMLYALIAIGSLGGVGGPALQGLISRNVGADEQGAVQGALTGLASIAGFLGLKLATGVFGYFVRMDSRVHLPGAAFFCSATLVFLGLLLAVFFFQTERRGNSKRPDSNSREEPQKPAERKEERPV